MEIKAKCKLDRRAVTAVSHLSTFKKANPKKTLVARTVLCLVLLLVILAESYFFGYDTVLVVLLALDIFVMGMDLFMYFGMPKIQYKAMARLREAENEYFFCEDGVKITSISPDYNSTTQMEYALLIKAYENTKYFFLFQTGNQVLPVDKSTITGGSAEEIRNKLSACLGKKYYICRY